MDQIINHAVLSLDFWQDTVTYEGCTMPAGTIGCEVLNIPDSTIEKLDIPCNVLNQLLQGMNTGSEDMELLPQVQQAAGEIISFLQATPPFSRLNRSYFEQKLVAIFSEEYMEDAKAYLQLTQQEQLICALTGQHSKATILVRIAQVLGHLSYSLGQYKEALTKFAERLNEPGYDRTPDGYAAMFGQFFKGEPTLSLDNPAWMTLTNASVQYVAAIRPGKTEPQLVKRMHYVSFVGMSSGCTMSPLWGCSVPICLRGFVWAMHPRNAPSAVDGFSPLMHGIPNTAVVWPPATNGDGRVGKLAI